ncbi:MAG: nucleotide-binding universal stress UspA family protein [Bacteroidia bacterium]|jgi:nucleotide-binding universal stress UspA family protein
MNSIKTPKDNIILVPTDLSTASNHAMDHAVGIAGLFDNQITLLYVVEESFFKSIFSGGMEKAVLLEAINAKLIEKAEAIKSKNPNLTVNTIVREGKVYKQIIEISQTYACDSIVMGFSGASGMDRFMGSTTTRVLKSSEVPVVIVKDVKSNIKYGKVILPIDLTRQSRQKVDWAMHIAKQYNSEIHVIMEIEKDEFLAKKVNASLKQVEGILSKNKINFVSKILDDIQYPDNFGKDVVQYADEVSADLIMIMTQKETGVQDYLRIGSFARHIIHESKNIPVMAIKPKEVMTYWATESFA